MPDIKHTRGRFEVSVGEIQVDPTLTQFSCDVTVACDGRLCFKSDNREGKELAELGYATSRLVNNYLKNHRAFREWVRDVAREAASEHQCTVLKHKLDQKPRHRF